jgi:AAA+ ATPase superfamily predicted ATPase
MRRVIKELEDSNIVFFYYNLREHATYSKEEFLEVFFEKDKMKYVKNNLILDLKVFKVGIEENYDFSKLSLNDIFKKIKSSINAVIEDGKKPVLIIDELQKLKNIYFNGNKSLLNELFNLFVSLTKMEHLCHVICLTSDTLFIEEIYQIEAKLRATKTEGFRLNSTLENTSEYYLIDWLGKGSIRNILKEEGFSEEEINYCLKYLSLPYEISQLINNKKLGLSVEETIKQWINIEADKILYLISTQKEFEMKRLVNALKLFEDKIKIDIKEVIRDNLMDEVKFLIKNEILFYDVVNGIIKPTSVKKWSAIREVLK